MNGLPLIDENYDAAGFMKDHPFCQSEDGAFYYGGIIEYEKEIAHRLWMPMPSHKRLVDQIRSSLRHRFKSAEKATDEYKKQRQLGKIWSFIEVMEFLGFDVTTEKEKFQRLANNDL